MKTRLGNGALNVSIFVNIAVKTRSVTNLLILLRFWRCLASLLP